MRTTSSSSSGQMPSSRPVSRPAMPSTNRSRSFCSASTAALVAKSNSPAERAAVEALALQRLLEALHVDRLGLVADRLRRDRAVRGELGRGIGAGRVPSRSAASPRRRGGRRRRPWSSARLPPMASRSWRHRPSRRRRRPGRPHRARRARTVAGLGDDGEHPDRRDDAGDDRRCAAGAHAAVEAPGPADVRGVHVARADHGQSRSLHRGSIASDCPRPTDPAAGRTAHRGSLGRCRRAAAAIASVDDPTTLTRRG